MTPKTNRWLQIVPTSLALLAWLAPAHAGGVPGAHALPSRALVPAIDPEAVYFDEPGDGHVWAVGATYKMSFGAEGAVYVPFLGSRAPQSYPLSLSLAEVSAGGRRLELDEVARVERDGDVVTLVRGAVSERYELGPRSVEQTFVVTSLPGDGELVVRVAFDTELAAQSSDDGLRFANELGAVVYGRATAVDASGRRRDLESRLTEGAIEIRVPASFARTARLPLAIDPVVTTFAIDTSSANDLYPDVAYNEATDHFLVCWERTVSATDTDVWSELHASDGTLVAGSGAYIDASTAAWHRPRVASLASAGQFLVVASTQTSFFGHPVVGVQGRLRSATSTAVGASIGITAGAPSGTPMNPDVSGDPTLSPARYFCVVWEHAVSATDHDILARRIDGNGNVIGATPIDISVSSGMLETNPAISRTNEGVTWNIVWQRQITAANHDIYAGRVNYDGSINHAAFAIATSASDDTQPAVSDIMTGTINWLVAFQRDMGGQHDIVTVLCSNAQVLQTMDLSQAEGFFPTRDQILPSVDTDGKSFAVVYSELFNPTTADYDLFVAGLYDSNGMIGVSEAHRDLAISTQQEIFARIATVQSGGGTGRRALIVWPRNATDIYGATYDMTVGGTKTPFCFGNGSGTQCPCSAGALGNGCPNSFHPEGANLFAQGDSSTTADTLVLHASSMPPNVNCTFFQGTTMSAGGAGTLFGDGLRCAVGTVIRLGSKFNDASGASSYPQAGDQSISVRGTVYLYGATRYYQASYRNAASFCTSATFNATNGVAVVWTL